MQSLEFDQETQISQQGRVYVSQYQVFREMLPLGFLAYGGPMAHIGILRKKFVDDKEWIPDLEFTELFGLCQSMPGPTSTQLAIAIGTLASGSWIGGVVAFLSFSIPSAIVMLVAGLMLQSIVSNERIGISNELQAVLLGFQVASIAIIAQAGHKLFKGGVKTRIGQILWVTGAVGYFVFPYTATMMILILLGATVNPIVVRNRNRFWMVYQEEPMATPTAAPKEYDKLDNDCLIGKNSLLLYLAIFIALKLIHYLLADDKTVMLADGFYTIGSLIIGGGHVVLPMILSHFQSLITADQFWNGFSLMSCLPGPMFNLAAYVGAVINGAVAGIVSWVVLYLPALFVVWGILPYWQNSRNTKLAKEVLQGISAVAIGFVATAGVQLVLKVSQELNPAFEILLAAVLYVELERFNVSVPLVVFEGGIVVLLMKVLK